jgi:hypothetical protein
MFAQVIASFLKMMLVEVIKWASSWIDAWLLKKRTEDAAKAAEEEQKEAAIEQDVNERRRRSLDFLNRDRS